MMKKIIPLAVITCCILTWIACSDNDSNISSQKSSETCEKNETMCKGDTLFTCVDEEWEKETCAKGCEADSCKVEKKDSSKKSSAKSSSSAVKKSSASKDEKESSDKTSSSSKNVKSSSKQKTDSTKSSNSEPFVCSENSKRCNTDNTISQICKNNEWLDKEICEQKCENGTCTDWCAGVTAVTTSCETDFDCRVKVYKGNSSDFLYCDTDKEKCDEKTHRCVAYPKCNENSTDYCATTCNEDKSRYYRWSLGSLISNECKNNSCEVLEARLSGRVKCDEWLTDENNHCEPEKTVPYCSPDKKSVYNCDIHINKFVEIKCKDNEKCRLFLSQAPGDSYQAGCFPTTVCLEIGQKETCVSYPTKHNTNKFGEYDQFISYDINTLQTRIFGCYWGFAKTFGGGSTEIFCASLKRDLIKNDTYKCGTVEEVETSKKYIKEGKAALVHATYETCEKLNNKDAYDCVNHPSETCRPYCWGGTLHFTDERFGNGLELLEHKCSIACSADDAERTVMCYQEALDSLKALENQKQE